MHVPNRLSHSVVLLIHDKPTGDSPWPQCSMPGTCFLALPPSLSTALLRSPFHSWPSVVNPTTPHSFLLHKVPCKIYSAGLLVLDPCTQLCLVFSRLIAHTQSSPHFWPLYLIHNSQPWPLSSDFYFCFISSGWFLTLV